MHGVSVPRSRVPYALGGSSEETGAGMQGRLGNRRVSGEKRQFGEESWWRLCGERVVLGVLGEDVLIDHVTVPY